MGALTIGRVGLDLDLDHPAAWEESRSLDERDMVVRGFLKSDTVANTKIIRSELLEQQGQLVAVTYTFDDHFNGFYVLGDVSVSTVPSSYMYKGLFPYEIGLFRIGGESRVELQSNMTGTVLSNDHGLLATEVQPWLAPPIGHLAFNWKAASVQSESRSTEDGSITLYLSTAGDFSEDASWGADPTSYYSGACDLWVGNPLRLRSGLDVPNDPANWQIDNGIIRVTPETSGSATTGRIQIECWGGSAWESLKDIAFDRGGSKINNFDYFTVSRNSPESVIIRLVTGSGAFARHVIDLQIRRGAPYLIGVWNYALAAGTLKVVRDTNEAAAAVSPALASGDVGVAASAPDGTGNKYFILTPQTHTNDLTAGGVSVASTTQIRFALGLQVDAASPPGTFNDLDDLAYQYFAMTGERVRAVWR